VQKFNAVPASKIRIAAEQKAQDPLANYSSSSQATNIVHHKTDAVENRWKKPALLYAEFRDPASPQQDAPTRFNFSFTTGNLERSNRQLAARLWQLRL
jgi:hypothetical protein